MDLEELYINVDDKHHVVVACETDLGAQVRYPFLWTFKNNMNPRMIGLQGWVKICAILKLPHGNNYIFICEGAGTIENVNKLDTYCCIEEFLTHDLVRSYGAAFSKLNDRKLAIPANYKQDGVIGVGMCISKENKYMEPGKFRINNQVFTIDTY